MSTIVKAGSNIAVPASLIDQLQGMTKQTNAAPGVAPQVPGPTPRPTPGPAPVGP